MLNCNYLCVNHWIFTLLIDVNTQNANQSQLNRSRRYSLSQKNDDPNLSVLTANDDEILDILDELDNENDNESQVLSEIPELPENAGDLTQILAVL